MTFLDKWFGCFHDWYGYTNSTMIGLGVRTVEKKARASLSRLRKQSKGSDG